MVEFNNNQLPNPLFCLSLNLMFYHDDFGFLWLVWDLYRSQLQQRKFCKFLQPVPVVNKCRVDFLSFTWLDGMIGLANNDDDEDEGRETEEAREGESRVRRCMGDRV